MELFNLHIQQGRDLCSKLSVVASHIKTAPAQLQTQLAIEVVSPILANSNNPLSTAHPGERLSDCRAKSGEPTGMAFPLNSGLSISNARNTGAGLERVCSRLHR